MSFDQILLVMKKLLANPIVLATTIIALILMNFAGYICYYRKKPPKPKINPAPVAAPEPAGDTGGEDDEGGDD